MTIVRARVILFTIWFGVFLMYLGLTFLPSSWGEVSVKLAKETMWKFVYVLFPVLGAFATFWFLPRLNTENLQELDARKLDASQVYAMFAITVGFHGLVTAYYWFTVLSLPYNRFATFENPEVNSYTENVDDVVKLLVFVSTALLLPVGFVLGEKVSVGQPGAGGGSDSEKEGPANRH